MGIVYKARHRQLNRIVALKMLGDGMQALPEQRGRFLIEAEAVARLRHPNIVQIYDIGDADGRPFVTLELLEGGTLADRLKGATQPGRAAAALVATLARAMHAAHQAGIIHRDLKPANILFDARRRPQDRRLRPGQAAGGRGGAHPDRPGHGHAQLHGPRAGPGATRTRSALRPTSTPWEPSSTKCSPAGRRSKATSRWRPSIRSSTTSVVLAFPAAAQGIARPGDDLSEVPRQGSAKALRQRPRAGRRPPPVPRESPDPRPPGAALGARGEMGPAASDPGHADRSGRGGVGDVDRRGYSP